MNRTRLAALASLVAAVVVGGITTNVWQANPDTTLADLQDAGVLDCPTRLVTCDWRVDAEGRDVLLDAGLDVPTGYRTLAARVAVCTNGVRDVVFPAFPARAGQLAGLASPDLGSCTVAADPGGALWRTAQSRCVRRQTDAGANCYRRNPFDGGTQDFGDWNSMPRADALGPDCQPAPCTVFAGEAP